MTKVTQSKLVCPECGNIFPIMRRTKHQRELFHKKRLYCYKCKKVTNHIELKDLEMWIAKMEFEDPEYTTEEEKKVYQLIKRRGE